jgi:hypothetical protein
MTAIAIRSGPEVWTGDDLRRDQSWSIALTPAHLAEIEAAVRAGAALPIAAIGQADFPLPTMGKLLGRVLDQLIDGRGGQDGRFRSRRIRRHRKRRRSYGRPSIEGSSRCERTPTTSLAAPGKFH